MLAGPAGADSVADDCQNTMNPANNGNSSGLIIACEFSGLATAGTSLTIEDYKDAVWHAGNARQVTVTVSRANSSEAGHYVVKWTGTGVACTTASCPAGTSFTGSATELGPVPSDVNHSIENLTSTVYDVQATSPLGSFIDAGTTIRSISPNDPVTHKDGYWVLSKPTIEGRNDAPTCPGANPCNKSNTILLTISNNVGREGNNGATTATTGTVTSAWTAATGCTGVDPADCSGLGTGNTSASQGMHFATGDEGNFFSGGDLPDGAQISTVNSATSVTLVVGPGSVGGAPAWNWGDGGTCLPAINCFTSVTSLSGLVITITPYPIPTSTKFINGATTIGIKGGTGGAGTATGERQITVSGSGLFSKFDVGMLVRGCDTSAVAGTICVSPTSIATGTRIISVTPGGATAVIDPVSGSGGTFTVGASQHMTVGIQTKTAPSTGDVIGSLAIGLIVDPGISPTSPPCAANKVSGFQLPIKWRNPGPSSGAGYDFGFAGPPINHFAGAAMTGVSNGQLTVLTSVTTFAGFLKQDVTVALTVPTTTRWRVHFESLPVGIGLCTGTGIAETLEIKGLSSKHAMNPSGTGGGFGATRALLPEAQGQTGGSTYDGTAGATAGANVIAGGAHTQVNKCTVTSPNIIGVGCQNADHADAS